MSKKISRRTFLEAMGATGAALALTACGSGAASTAASTASSAAGSSASSAALSDTGSTTVMDEPSGSYTPLTVWTFIELHQKFYIDMATKWNQENPDKQVRLTLVNIGYDDMHNKLRTTLDSGTGFPDVVDIEIGKFPGFLSGSSIKLMDLSSAIDPYRSSIVESRLEIYTKDKKTYGFPTHMGTTVAFYNKELCDGAGVDYTAIKTWDDWKKAGEAYFAATGKAFSYVETSASWIVNMMLCQKGGSYLDKDGKPNLQSQELTDVLTFLKSCQDDKKGAFTTMPGGQPDTEEGYGAFNQGDFACQIMPFWQTSRFVNYMTDLKGKVEMCSVPRFSESDACWTIGGGGTGTAVVAAGASADLASQVFAYIKLSDEASVQIWNVLGFDPINKNIWKDESVTHNPDNQYVQYFANNPFDPLLEMQDSIGALTDQISEYWPDIANEISTVTLNSIFEEGAEVADALADAQSTVETYVD